MSQTLADLKAACRRRVSDDVEDYLFDDAAYTAWANEAVREACLRARFFQDDETSAVCQIALVDGTHTYSFDSSIVVIQRAAITTGGTRKDPLTLASYSELDNFNQYWDDSTPEAEPHTVVINMTQRKLRVTPVPDASYTLSLKVERLPLTSEEMVNQADTPILPDYMHEGLVHWMAHQFYSQHDPEAFSEVKADRELALFAARYGQRPSWEMIHRRQFERPRRSVPQFM